MNSFHFMISKLNNVFREDFLVFLIFVWYSASKNDPVFINTWNTFYCHFWFFTLVSSLLTFHSWIIILTCNSWVIINCHFWLVTLDHSPMCYRSWVATRDLPFLIFQSWFVTFACLSWLVTLDLSLAICHAGLATLDLSLLPCHSWLVTFDLSLLTCQSSLFKLCWNFWRDLTSIWIFSLL